MSRMRGLGVAVLGCCAAGCTGSLFQSKAAPPTVYVLYTDAAAPGVATPGVATPDAGARRPEIPVDLAVLKPQLRPGLESDRIAVLYPDRHLDYFAAARWSGPLGDVLQDAAVQEFHTRGNLRTVSGDASVFTTAYWLELEVADFQAEYTAAATVPTVHVHLEARIGNSGDRHIIGRFTATARQPAAENRLTAIVGAYARAADAALADIVADVDATLEKSEAR